MKKAILFALLLATTACAYVDPALTEQSKVYYDSPVRKSALQVSIHPRAKQFRPLTAYFHPFVIQQQNDDYHHLSTAFAQIFSNVWTEERLFPIQEFQPGTPYEGVNKALSRARQRGADLLILGFVPYFFAGHTLDDTAITIQINIYSTATGDLLWTMMQSGRIEDKFPDDYVYFRVEYRLSDAPFNKLIRAIAKDMAVPLKGWLPSPDTRYPYADNAEAIHANLTATNGPQPPLGEQAADNGPMGKDLPTPTRMPDKDDAPDENAVPRPFVNGVNLDVHFDTDKATIKAESFRQLDALGEALNTPELKGKNIIIGGHADNRGNAQYNLDLSKRRAQSVKQYIVNKWGVNPDLIEAVGYGESRPVQTGQTTQAYSENRRVEIRLAE